MVIAQVPLWVIHSSNATSSGAPLSVTTSASSAQSNNSHGNDKPGKASACSALSSLNLLKDSSSRRKKSSIYSVDVSPKGTLFATAGGDGAVRLWNAQALFTTRTTSNGNDGSRRDGTNAGSSTARLLDNGDGTTTYVSSSTSSTSSSSEDDDDDDNNNDTTANGHHHHDTSTNGGSATGGSGTSPTSRPAAAPVHDLSGVVRRKKDGTAPTPQRPVRVAAAAAAQEESDNATPLTSSSSSRLIATLSAHTGSSVLVVRFSTTGDFLASAGDDAVVCIYSNNNNHHWARIKVCRGHNLDVLDLAWAPDDLHLVSCSLDKDSPIIVWNLTDLHGDASEIISRVTSPQHILGRDVHTSTVKGVAFDPAGSYVASSADGDPAVCIWRAHDNDWGLERSIPLSMFTSSSMSLAQMSSSMFRRLCWSTDGAFLCCTNSIVKNKHVASTIARQLTPALDVANADSGNGATANLVGHKQAVVVSRAAPCLLSIRKEKTKNKANSGQDQNSDMEMTEEDDDDDVEPDYASLLALGDKRGFVTVWSTHESRPLFKLQCSEHRVTVTDLAWGRMPNDDSSLMLLVTLLDGQVVSLQFNIPEELDPFLSPADQAKVFRLRYGIEIQDTGMMGAAAGGGRGGHFVGKGASASSFIENPIQMTYEREQQQHRQQQAPDSTTLLEDEESEHERRAVVPPPAAAEQQKEEILPGGKKRVRPILLVVNNENSSAAAPVKKTKLNNDAAARMMPINRDPLQNAMELAEKASTVASKSTAKRQSGGEAAATSGLELKAATEQQAASSPTPRLPACTGTVLSSSVYPLTIPHKTDRTYNVDLPVHPVSTSSITDDLSSSMQLTAECTNSRKVPSGSASGALVACVDVSICKNGRASWTDELVGTSCCALDASTSFLVLGTTDGTLYLFGTSSTLGWKSELAFRSHPPVIMGHSIVSLQLKEKRRQDNSGGVATVDMLVATSDGAFAVYGLLPELKLHYKGSILPAMVHMAQCDGTREIPQLNRIQLADSGRLLSLISLNATASRTDKSGANSTRGVTASRIGSFGGSLQAFLYDRSLELWLRISDSRFVLSDFYSALSSRSKKGELEKLDDAVRIGALSNSMSLKAVPRRTLHLDAMYDEEGSLNAFLPTRAHCEDRIACAIALHSTEEFKIWLSLYARALGIAGQLTALRMLVDLLMGDQDVQASSSSFWWVNSLNQLGLDGGDLVKSSLLPALSKNRSLQRLTHEISLEISSLQKNEKCNTPA